MIVLFLDAQCERNQQDQQKKRGAVFPAANPDQPRAKGEVLRSPPSRRRLQPDRLQQRGEEVLFLLMMPGIEPDRTEAEVRQISLQQVHERALAAAPFA